jgi:hypothetical protein
MYEKYNAALRQASGVQYLIDKFNQLCKGNNYATTIHAINSAVLKLSKLTQAVKVWRGFKGATDCLPHQALLTLMASDCLLHQGMARVQRRHAPKRVLPAQFFGRTRRH